MAYYKAEIVFVPFPGDFFSINEKSRIVLEYDVFVPFPGDFFSINKEDNIMRIRKLVFVPFPGDFFSIWKFTDLENTSMLIVFVPFPGDFFSIN